MRFIPGLTFFWLLLVSNFCSGQPDHSLIVSPAAGHVVVGKPFLVQFADTEPQRPLAAVRRLPAHQWKAVNAVNFGNQRNTGWARVQLTSPVAQTIWLELESHFIDSVQVWLIRQPGTPHERITAYQPTGFRSLSLDRDAPTRHPFFLKPLHLAPAVRYTLYVRGWVPPGDVLKFDVNLWQPTAFEQYQQRFIAGWALFMGLVLMSVFITLISYAFHPRRIYLYYSGYVLCMSIYAWLNDGWGMYNTPQKLDR